MIHRGMWGVAGAFLLARAGLLDGRRATTHWAACAALARNYPAVSVESDPIFVRDGNVYTSAGVTAGIDLALALVEEDLGRQAALAVARSLVLFIRRPGGQAQFSAGLAGQAAARPGLNELQAWIAEHLDHDLSVPALAERAFMSPRNFARVFANEVGVTPAAYVEAVRLERARTLLETTELQLDDVARRCGFGTVETLRRVFGRRLGVNPSDYHNQFLVTFSAVNPVAPGFAEITIGPDIADYAGFRMNQNDNFFNGQSAPDANNGGAAADVAFNSSTFFFSPTSWLRVSVSKKRLKSISPSFSTVGEFGSVSTF